jgi:hypothetical protein
MFVWLRSLVSAAAVIELHSRRIRVRDVSGGTTFEFEPILSIDGSQRVVSVGRPIPASAVKTHAPFENPTSFAKEPHVAKLILAFAYSRLGSVAWLKPAPRIVLLVRSDDTNGVQLVGDDALAELSTSAGARTTVICRGRSLSDHEALRLLDAAPDA